jgi:hypothetical protein
VGFVVDIMALGHVSYKYFSFHCPFSLHQMLHTHLSYGAGAMGELVPDGHSLTPPDENYKKLLVVW